MVSKSQRAAAQAAKAAKAAAAFPTAPAALAMALAPVQRRSPSGRLTRTYLGQRERDAARPALEARARHMGWIGEVDPSMTAAERTLRDKQVAAACRRASTQSLEGEVGVLLHAAVRDPDDRREMWSCWDAFSRAHLAYHRRVLGRDPLLRAARVELIPERIETRGDEAADLRTPEERLQDALRVWGTWRASLEAVEIGARSALLDATLGKHALLTSAPPVGEIGQPETALKLRPTPAGHLVLAALRKLAL